MNNSVPLWLRILAWQAFAGWVGTIFYFSSLTGPEIADFNIHLWDKAEHFAAFTVGGILLTLALRWTVSWPWKSVARFAVLALVTYGALDEIHQLFTPKRSGADVFDWLADSFGSLFGVFLLVVIYVRISRRSHPPASPGA